MCKGGAPRHVEGGWILSASRCPRGVEGLAGPRLRFSVSFHFDLLLEMTIQATSESSSRSAIASRASDAFFTMQSGHHKRRGRGKGRKRQLSNHQLTVEALPNDKPRPNIQPTTWTQTDECQSGAQKVRGQATKQTTTNPTFTTKCRTNVKRQHTARSKGR